MKEIFDREARKRFDDQHLRNRRKVCRKKCPFSATIPTHTAKPETFSLCFNHFCSSDAMMLRAQRVRLSRLLNNQLFSTIPSTAFVCFLEGERPVLPDVSFVSTHRTVAVHAYAGTIDQIPNRQHAKSRIYRSTLDHLELERDDSTTFSYEVYKERGGSIINPLCTPKPTTQTPPTEQQETAAVKGNETKSTDYNRKPKRHKHRWLTRSVGGRLTT